MSVVIEYAVSLQQWAEIPGSERLVDPASVSDWATRTAELISGPDVPTAQVTSFADGLAALVAGQRDVPADVSFLLIGGLAAARVVVDVVAFPASGDSRSTHLRLGRADLPGAWAPAQVDDVSARHLGVGVRVIRCDPREAGLDVALLDASARYLWRIGAVDLGVSVSAAGLGALVAALPAVEDLLDSLRVSEGVAGQLS